MRKLRHRESKSFAQGHTASKVHSLILEPRQSSCRDDTFHHSQYYLTGRIVWFCLRGSGKASREEVATRGILKNTQRCGRGDSTAGGGLTTESTVRLGDSRQSAVCPKCLGGAPGRRMGQRRSTHFPDSHGAPPCPRPWARYKGSRMPD